MSEQSPRDSLSSQPPPRWWPQRNTGLGSMEAMVDRRLGWIAVGALFVVYTVLLAGTVLIAKTSIGIPIFCPAVGAAIGIAYLAVRRRSSLWIAVAAVVFVGELIAWQVDGTGWRQVVAMGLVHAIEVVTAALSAIAFRARYDVVGPQLRGVAIILVAAVSGPSLGAMLVAAGAHAMGVTGSAVDFAVTWWLADILGVLTVMPFVTSLSRTARDAWQPSDVLLPGEAALATLAMLGATALLTTGLHRAYTFPGIFVTMWIAIRLGVGATSAAVLLFASVLSLATGWETGPFIGEFAKGWARAFIACYVIVLLIVSVIARERRRALDEARQMHESLDRATHTDELTGLATRRVMEERADLLLANHRTGATAPAGLMLALDFDEFATVNTLYGRACADAALCELASRIRAQFAQAECIARIGGDEFAILLHGDHSEQAAHDIATQVRHLVAVPVFCNDIPVSITASVGAALARGGDADQLLRDVEAALHDAKATGRNRVVVRTPMEREQADREQELINRLPQALSQREFICVFQPIAPLPGRPGTLGVEMLTRWLHPTRGQLQPGEFLPPLHRAGLMPRLGSYLMDEALRNAAVWQASAASSAPRWVSVNMSPTELMAVDVVGRVRASLSALALAPGWLTIEITEEAMVAMSGAVRGILADIRALGVRIAVDDFGTGFSGLAYLTQLPIDIVKLDRQFLMASEETRAHQLLRSVCSLAEDLGLRTVVEGVETKEQYERAGEAGADAVQGWYVGRPETANELAVALTAGHTFGRDGAAA